MFLEAVEKELEEGAKDGQMTAIEAEEVDMAMHDSAQDQPTKEEIEAAESRRIDWFGHRVKGLWS